MTLITNRIDGDRVYSPEEQFFALYHRELKNFVMELIENPDGKYDHLFKQTDDFQSQNEATRL